MAGAVIVDVAGGPAGGAARFRGELYQYLSVTGREDVEIIGDQKRLAPSWLLRREVAWPSRSRKVALNNVGFLTPGGERWTLLGNALHFLTDAEISSLHPSLRPVATQQAIVVRLAAKRSDVLIAPCSAMAERVASIVPSVKRRLTVRMHPVSANTNQAKPTEPLILCPVIFEEYKHMPDRLTEWVNAVDEHVDPAVRMIVTASPSEVPTSLACSRRIELVGRLKHAEIRKLWARSRAVYFPTGLESFGFPLAEARVNGQPIIARDTPQTREIAGAALHGFTLGNLDSLRLATELALSADVDPDPEAFNPADYFDWMLGPHHPSA